MGSSKPHKPVTEDELEVLFKGGEVHRPYLAIANGTPTIVTKPLDLVALVGPAPCVICNKNIPIDGDMCRSCAPSRSGACGSGAGGPATAKHEANLQHLTAVEASINAEMAKLEAETVENAAALQAESEEEGEDEKMEEEVDTYESLSKQLRAAEWGSKEYHEINMRLHELHRAQGQAAEDKAQTACEMAKNIAADRDRLTAELADAKAHNAKVETYHDTL